MAVIKILDENVSNAIAAGEVVENPTSMIKELIENSLDAGSTEINIEVKNAGLEVTMTDNGCGMEKEDLLLSIERHATSKISTKEDLFKISTYGFRGEALSSISAVSKMIISSKTKNMEEGNQINILGGKITNIKNISRNVGTSIQIKDLFYNTPARLKFLRKENTEFMNIKDIIIKEALANPQVKFTLILNSKLSIRTSGNGIENCLLEIFGKNYLKNSQKFNLGYLGNAELFRASRDSIFVFINGRSVKSKLIEDAVIEGYHTKLMKGKYPFAIISLDINPDEIDVNVHPAKKIVKFSDNGNIYKLVKNEIDLFFINDEDFVSPHLTFEENDNSLEMEVNLNEKRKNLENPKEFSDSSQENLLKIDDFKKNLLNETEKYGKLSQLSSTHREDYNIDVNSLRDVRKIDEINLKVQDEFNDFKQNYNPTENKNNISEEKILETNLKKSTVTNSTDYIFDEKDTSKGKIFESFDKLKNINFRVIGQIFDTFILVERNSLFEIYDQHIIHERILYEKLKQEYYSHTVSKQSLLVPIRINLDPREKEIILANLDLFSSFGFEIDDFDGSEILVRTTPIMNLRDSFENIIKNILENILANKDEDVRENILVSMSCKGAIKANHKLTMEEMYSMVAKLHEVGKYTCPHGRPIIVKMSLYDLEKLFKRK